MGVQPDSSGARFQGTPSNHLPIMPLEPRRSRSGPPAFSMMAATPVAILGRIMKSPFLVLLLAAGAFAADEVKPEDPAKGLEKKVGQEFTFTDEILHKTKKQELKGYVKFETVHLRCIVASEDEAALDLLATLLKERSPRRAAITGTVTLQKDLQVFFEVSSIERPRYKKRGAK